MVHRKSENLRQACRRTRWWHEHRWCTSEEYLFFVVVVVYAIVYLHEDGVAFGGDGGVVDAGVAQPEKMVND